MKLKLILEFDETEIASLKEYIDGPSFRYAIQDLDHDLRGKAKYEDLEWAAKARELLHETLKSRDLELF